MALCEIEHHPPPSGEATPSLGTWKRIRAPWLHHQCQQFFEKLQEFWVVTNQGILGLSGYHDCVQSIRVLGRIVERTNDGITWEADPRHAELVKEIVRFSRSASDAGVVVKVAKTCHAHILVRCGPCLQHPKQEKCFWLCVDAGYQYNQHVLQRTGRDCAQLRLYWTGDGNARLACGWKPQLELRLRTNEGRGLGRVKHIDTVFFWVQEMVTEGKVTLGKKPTKKMLADFPTKNVDAATMSNCMTGLDMKFQSGENKLTLKA